MPWLDAAWHPPGWVEGPLPFDASDRGLTLGDGVFDTALVLNGRMIWRDAHVGRLEAACRVIGFSVARLRLEAAVGAVLERLREGSMRITVTRGPGPRGLAPPVEICPTIVATGAAGRPAFGTPLRLVTAAMRRNDTSPLARIKSLNYADAVLAGGEARAAGADEALFLNTRGHVACTTVANLAAVIGSDLVMPPPDEGTVPGLARAALRDLARDLELVAVERPLAPDELGMARALWTTNSLRLLAEVTMLDGQSCRCAPALADAARRAFAAQVAGEAGLSAVDLV